MFFWKKYLENVEKNDGKILGWEEKCLFLEFLYYGKKAY